MNWLQKIIQEWICKHTYEEHGWKTLPKIPKGGDSNMIMIIKCTKCGKQY